jgi:transcriptional regulator with XRE-family HTH domain
MATKTRPARQKKRESTGSDNLQFVRVVKVGQSSKLELRDRLKMRREDFSRLVDVSVRAIAKVERDQTDVAKLRRPYAELGRLYTALSEVVDKKAIGRWFGTPNQAFGGMKPIEVIEHGEIDRLWDMVYRLRSGIPG